MVRSASIYIWSGHKQPREEPVGQPVWNALALANYVGYHTPVSLQMRKQCTLFL